MKIDLFFIYRNIRYYLPSFFKYRIFGHLFKNQQVNPFFLVDKHTTIAKNFKAGTCVQIGAYSYISPKVTIGNFALISDHVNIIGHDHVYNTVSVPSTLAGRPADYLELETILGDDVWIGHGVTIMRGVHIQEGSIIASNSVVTKNVPAYTIYGGIPAKFIKERFSTEEINQHSQFLKDFREGKYRLNHDNKPDFTKLSN
jgi:acetyltransferase-like isoleucine patch superfamily enzyme